MTARLDQRPDSRCPARGSWSAWLDSEDTRDEACRAPRVVAVRLAKAFEQRPLLDLNPAPDTHRAQDSQDGHGQSIAARQAEANQAQKPACIRWMAQHSVR